MIISVTVTVIVLIVAIIWAVRYTMDVIDSNKFTDNGYKSVVRSDNYTYVSHLHTDLSQMTDKIVPLLEDLATEEKDLMTFFKKSKSTENNVKLFTIFMTNVDKFKEDAELIYNNSSATFDSLGITNLNRDTTILVKYFGGKTSTYTQEGLYSFVLNDPIHKITLDILPTRKKDYLIDYFLKVKNRKSVKVVICDLYRPYYEVVKICFPKAIFVADPFHYIKYVTKGLDDVRIRLVHKYEDNKRSKEYIMFKNRTNKSLLLKSFNETKGELKIKQERQEKYDKGLIKQKPYDKFNDYWYGTIKIKKNNQFVEIYRIDRLQEVLNMNSELLEAYNLKEEFLRITTHVKYKDAKRQLKEWVKQCYDSKIPEMVEAANTINNWINEIVNSFKDERYSNGFTEANNNTITKIVDRAYGYKNFKFFRLRTLVILHKSYSGGSRKNIENGQNHKNQFF